MRDPPGGLDLRTSKQRGKKDWAVTLSAQPAQKAHGFEIVIVGEDHSSKTARSVELGFGFGLKTGNCTVTVIHYATSTVNFAKMDPGSKMNSPFRPRSQNGRNHAHRPDHRLHEHVLPVLFSQ